jgi:hypothetical protein
LAWNAQKTPSLIAVAQGTCLFAKPLLSNGCCIAASFAIVAKQRVYMPQYIEMQDFKLEDSTPEII